MTRRLALLPALLLLLPLPAAGAALPRLVSLNLCADELLLRLAAPGQLLSVTWLARDPSASSVVALLPEVPVNHGLAEEILPLAPDLVVAGRYTTRHAVAFLRQVGVPVLELSPPDSLAEAVAQIRELGLAIGRPAEGAALAAELESALAVPPPEGADPLAAIYRPNGFTVGAGTLADELLRRAGLRNLAAEQGLAAYDSLPLEALLLGEPDLLIVDDESAPPALADAILRHPALAGRYQGPRRLVVPSRLWTCAGPALGEALALLRRGRAGVAEAP